MSIGLTHAVSRLCSARLARSSKPFLARGGPRGERCAGCRLVLSHCLCALRPVVPTRAGVYDSRLPDRPRMTVDKPAQ